MICPTCGERIDDATAACPFCETPVTPSAPARSGMAVVNLKKGRPTVDVARDRLDAAIRNHQLRSTEGLVLIHGYGSSGEGGRIREIVLERLQSLKHDGAIRDYVAGENIGRVHTGRLPSSYSPSRSDVGNWGITVVRL